MNSSLTSARESNGSLFESKHTDESFICRKQAAVNTVAALFDSALNDLAQSINKRMFLFQAVTRECCARFHLHSLVNTTAGDDYMHAAYRQYTKWGATVKTEMLRSEFYSLFSAEAPPVRDSASLTHPQAYSARYSSVS